MEYLSEHLQANLIFLFGELFVLILILLLIQACVKILFQRSSQISFLKKYKNKADEMQTQVSWRIFVVWLLLSIVALGASIYFIFQGYDLWSFSQSSLVQVDPDFWFQTLKRFAIVAGLLYCIRFLIRLLKRTLSSLEEKCNEYDGIKANDESIALFFGTFEKIIKNTIWLSFLIFSAQILDLPDVSIIVLQKILFIYLSISIGLLFIRALSAIIDSLDAITMKYSSPDNFLGFYKDLQIFGPLLRHCLQYSIYVFMASLVIAQIDFIAKFSLYGPKIIQSIAIFFLLKLTLDALHFFLDRGMFSGKKLSERERQKRLTLAPIIKAIMKYVIFFVAVLLWLKVFGVNPIPLLAGAGILGVVIGLGAQPLLNDLMSGLFIITEQLFLVGDYVETGNARGYVEKIDLRTTLLRDPNGQLHILNNGQLGDVINFSKGYAYAVVEVGVSYNSDMDYVYKVIEEAGKEFKTKTNSVIEPTFVDGIVDFQDSGILVRTITKVQPGHHLKVGYQFRTHLKAAFDRANVEIPFPQRVVHFADKNQFKENEE